MKSKLTKITQTLCVSALLGLSFSNASAMSLKEWPVADDALRKAMVGLSGQFETQAEMQQKMMELHENNATAINIASTSVNIMKDLKKTIKDSTPDLNKCQVLTKRLAGGATGKANTMFNELMQESQNLLTTTGSSGFDATKDRAKLKTCTDNDVLMGIGGCTKADIVPHLSGASENPLVLMQDLKTHSGTVNKDQIPAAKAFINSIGDYIPKSSVAGQNNAEYNKLILGLQRNAAVSRMALSQVLTNHTPLATDTTSAEGQTLFNQNAREDYQRFFHAPMPSQPSAYDRMRLRVYQDAYGINNNQSTDEVAVLRDIAEKLSQQNLLLEKIMTYSETQQVQLAANGETLGKIATAVADPTKHAAAAQ